MSDARLWSFSDWFFVVLKVQIAWFLVTMMLGLPVFLLVLAIFASHRGPAAF